jgi:hypothetical protein
MSENRASACHCTSEAVPALAGYGLLGVATRGLAPRRLSNYAAAALLSWLAVGITRASRNPLAANQDPQYAGVRSLVGQLDRASE